MYIPTTSPKPPKKLLFLNERSLFKIQAVEYYLIGNGCIKQRGSFLHASTSTKGAHGLQRISEVCVVGCTVMDVRVSPFNNLGYYILDIYEFGDATKCWSWLKGPRNPLVEACLWVRSLGQGWVTINIEECQEELELQK